MPVRFSRFAPSAFRSRHLPDKAGSLVNGREMHSPCLTIQRSTGWASTHPTILLESWSDLAGRKVGMSMRARILVRASMLLLHQTYRGNDIMKTSMLARAWSAALIGTALASASARAEIKNYEFQLSQPTVQAGPDRIITVRLVDKATGNAVPDAVIFATRLDMAPDAMQEMATKVTPMPGAEPGTYRFKANFGMAGHWQLSLGAKVQGETGTVESKLVITADK